MQFAVSCALKATACGAVASAETGIYFFIKCSFFKSNF